MSAQTTLTEDAPLILDATCSLAKIWPRYASIRMDIRKEVNPDIVASACYLPFRDGIFNKIFCDPPHIIDVRITSKSSPLGSKMKARFGYWSHPREWKKFIQLTNQEFKRCMKLEASLEYKVVDGKWYGMTKLRDLQSMNNFIILSDKARPSAGSKNNTTHFLSLKPKPCQK